MKEKPEILYPCRWEYKIIGHNEQEVRSAVEKCLDRSECIFEPSNQSRTGKYKSFRLETTVISEEDRDRIFFELRDAPGVKMVL